MYICLEVVDVGLQIRRAMVFGLWSAGTLKLEFLAIPFELFYCLEIVDLC